MQSIQEWNHLLPFGIDLLTGEACGLGYRGLVDLTARGKKIVCTMLGLPLSAAFEENWNHGTDEDPHVASIMLPYDMLVSLAIFALIDDGASSVHWSRCSVTQRVYGVYSDEDLKQLNDTYERHIYEPIRVFSIRSIPGVTSADGLRNVHQSTGRTT